MKFFKHLLLISVFWCGAISMFAQAWTQSNVANTNWFGVANSADGSVLFAAVGNTNENAIHISTNSGVTWTPTTPPITNSRFGLAVSADGTTVFASRRLQGSSPYGATNSNPFFFSTNSGNTWTPLMDSTTNRPYGVAISADGRTLIGSTSQGTAYSSTQAWVYISTNSGAIWSSNQLSSSSGYVLDVGVYSSADGSRFSSLIRSLSSFGVLLSTFWTTTNSGFTWIQSSLPGSPISSPWTWSYIASSADGNKWVAVGYNATHQPAICTSTNAGTSWNAMTVSLLGVSSLSSISSSADGTKLVTTSGSGANPGPVFVSTNSGVTWVQTAAPITNWNALASSADGNKLVATVDASQHITTASGGLWTSYSIPAPSMNITPTNGCPKISWIMPSTNFVMQQSSDLQNWADMTNQPVLNLANLQDEVVLPPSSNVFYRLKTP